MLSHIYSGRRGGIEAHTPAEGIGSLSGDGDLFLTRGSATEEDNVATGKSCAFGEQCDQRVIGGAIDRRGAQPGAQLSLLDGERLLAGARSDPHRDNDTAWLIPRVERCRFGHAESTRSLGWRSTGGC